MVIEEPGGCGCISYVMSLFVAAVMGFFAPIMGGSFPPDIDTPPQFTLEIELAPASDYDAAALEATADIISQRLQASDVDLYILDITEDDTIIVRSSDGRESVIAAIQGGGLLEFVNFSGVEDIDPGAMILTDGQLDLLGENAVNMDLQRHPITRTAYETVLTNSGIASAEAVEGDFGWVIEVTFTETGGDIIGNYTEANIGEPLAIVLDGEVLSVPIVQSRLDQGALITGNFTADEAQILATQLNTAALPIVLDVIRVTQISD